MGEKKLENIPILDDAQMRALEEKVILSGTPGFELMRRAGQEVANFTIAAYPNATFLVLAGPGNNGGDGFIAAQSLLEMDKKVSLLLTQGSEAYKGDALKALQKCHAHVIPEDEIREILKRQNLVIIDALFGIGLSRLVSGYHEALIHHVNESGRSVIAVDIPSGIKADSGAIMGIAVKAAHTMTFAAPKPGHLLYPGREYSGRLHIADIGLGPVTSPYQVNGPIAFSSSKIRHKYSRGYCLVLGSEEMPGASMLAARAARRAGAGIVAMAAPAATRDLHLSYQPGVIFKPTGHAEEFKNHLRDKRIGALIIGCGLDERCGGYLKEALAKTISIVIDGGALQEGGRFSKEGIVMTPHEGEFVRAFPAIKTECKLQRALEAAKTRNAVIVLKGPDTIIAAPDGRARININAGPELATAGSGDVLAGIIGGLLAQSWPAFDAAAFGVWLHGAAGALFSQGLIAEDLPDLLPAILKQMA